MTRLAVLVVMFVLCFHSMGQAADPTTFVDSPAPPIETQEPVPTCDQLFSVGLEKYFQYRKWDQSHIAIIEKAIETWKPDYTPIDVKTYDFWGDDGPNLRAFVRDQRFGAAHDSIVVAVSDTVRYTIFRCECGITAIYREIKKVVIYTPPPKKKRPPPPSDETPKAWCIDPGTKRQTSC